MTQVTDGERARGYPGPTELNPTEDTMFKAATIALSLGFGALLLTPPLLAQSPPPPPPPGDQPRPPPGPPLGPPGGK